MAALGRRAGITGHRGVVGLPVDDGLFVGGIAHPRGGPCREHRIDPGAHLGGEVSRDAARPVGALRPDRHPAPMSPIDVREVAVGVEHQHHVLGEPRELVGPGPGGDRRELPLGFCAGGFVDPVRQPTQASADDAHLLRTDLPGGLPGRGGLQPRRQRLTGQRLPRPQISGLLDQTPRFGAADPQQVGQHIAQ
ncbi:MAG: hypothetical protein QOH60_3565 [Mycobacterium sp.]|nr:hypothetical protein [Mycobacterium sp.]